MLINGNRADDLAGTGLIAKQRWVIPLWLSLIGLAIALIVKTAAVLLWLAVKHPRTTAVLANVLVVYWFAGLWGLLALFTTVLAGAIVWAWLRPGSWNQVVAQPVWGWWRWNARYRWLWYPALNGSGLTITTPDRQVYVPKVTSVTSTSVVDTLHVRLLHGHTLQDLSEKAEGLRHSFGCHGCTIVEDGPGRVRVILYARDPLTTTVPAFGPAALPAVPDLGALPVGKAEDGKTYRLRLIGNHVLVAGATGAGKGSVIWSVIRALGPGIHSGLVRVHGIDPKGGMELYSGRALFTGYADDTTEEMVTLLELAVTEMTARKKRLRGQVRAFVPSVTDPLVVVLIDELAFLSAYTDKATKLRVAMALQLLLSQGRAVGYSVVACLQDPRKEVLPFRDLFPYRVALRLAEDSHVDMVLGDGALDRGAACHLIPDTLPGVGYVHVDGAHEPVRVRFTWITDDDITDMATRWPAPPAWGSNVVDLRDDTNPASGQINGWVPEPRNTPSERTDRTDGGELA